ncbi:alpha/beta fold hydrolase [Pengzhenrongella sicca]|uniref:Alpha/beta hydrolase n=1 Tax=Pengzhenrongella sicca TaxID=2819238 RepID=A0A8A4ZFX2_9MICO|nr:alpha/beta hydrolase [Pengzhenrongella sicca]QTE29436.1 alpha/beta hydrolase [Pengzhenrongella sicca]
MTTAEAPIQVVLVPGFWLGAWAWDDVVGPLRAAGLVPHAVTLPGLESVDADRSAITRADHERAVRELVERLPTPVVLVGHSGGGAVVETVVDQLPDRIRRVVYVDSGPLVDGAALFPDLPASAVDLPLPPWDELEANGSSAAGLDDAARAEFAARAVPQPARVAREPVHLTDPRRLDVPVTAICTSLPAEVLKTLAHPGPPLHTELGSLDVTYVDLPTGHWPMFSRPADLANEIAAAARA